MTSVSKYVTFISWHDIWVGYVWGVLYVCKNGLWYAIRVWVPQRHGLPPCLRISNSLERCIIQMSICNIEIGDRIFPSIIVLRSAYVIRYLVVCIWTHRHRETHICVGELDDYCLNKSNKYLRNVIHITTIVMHENVFENVVFRYMTTLSRSQYIETFSWASNVRYPLTAQIEGQQQNGETQALQICRLGRVKTTSIETGIT